jgi:acyl-CoA thioester hydrolase
MAGTNFTKEYQVRWSDLDPNGHMRNSAYEDYATDARLQMLAEFGFSQAYLLDLGLGPVILRQEVRYYRELRLGEKFKLTVRLAGISSDGSRWKIQHLVLRSNGEQAAQLMVEGTWLDLSSRKSAIPPQELVRLSQSMERTAKFEPLRSLVRVKQPVREVSLSASAD